jgi:hypothetical protein
VPLLRVAQRGGIVGGGEQRRREEQGYPGGNAGDRASQTSESSRPNFRLDVFDRSRVLENPLDPPLTKGEAGGLSTRGLHESSHDFWRDAKA